MGTADERVSTREVRESVDKLVSYQARSVAVARFSTGTTLVFALLSVVYVLSSALDDASLGLILALTSAGVVFLTFLAQQASTLARASRGIVSRLSALLGDSGASASSTRATSSTHRSIHHLFGVRDRLLPKKDDPPVDLALDAADLPEALLSYLELLARNDIEARVLLLDPDSPLVSRHRFAVAEGSDKEPSTQRVRDKMRKAITSMQALANVRLYDAMPLGNLVIVGDRIYWGGIPSVPTDVSLPVVELAADVHGDLYWSYRRNFDRLWDSAKPADASAEPPPQIASQAG